MQRAGDGEEMGRRCGMWITVGLMGRRGDAGGGGDYRVDGEQYCYAGESGFWGDRKVLKLYLIIFCVLI